MTQQELQCKFLDETFIQKRRRKMESPISWLYSKAGNKTTLKP